jgi:hypothetical protein
MDWPYVVLVLVWQSLVDGPAPLRMRLTLNAWIAHRTKCTVEEG